MAGRPRKRRASNSTVETVDESHIRWIKESSVLRPARRDIAEDDWPCYVLTDATIYRKDGETLANPLLVHLQGPLVVRGRLEVDEDDLRPNLVKPGLKCADIQISHSDRYSISDEPLALWVSGAAGWFEIRPSPKYQPMYDQIMEATTLYYGIFVTYEAYVEACGSKKKSNRPRPPTLDQLFLKYAVKVGSGIVRDEVEAMCHKWAEFLIAQFPRDAQLDWDRTLFAQWLRESHPDVQKRLTDAANGVLPPPPPPPPPPQDTDEDEVPRKRRSRSAKTSSRSSEVEGVEMRDLAAEASRSRQPKLLDKGKPKMPETPVPRPEKYRDLSQPASAKPSPAPKDALRDTPMSDANAESPVDRLLGVLREIAAAGDLDIPNAPQSRVNNAVFFKIRVKKYAAAKEVVAYYAKELVPRVDAVWKTSPWYEWLKTMAKQPWTSEHVKEEDIPEQTTRRVKSTRTPAPSTAPATQLPTTINLKARTKKTTAAESEDDPGEDATAASVSRRGRPSGKEASLRLMSSSKKRPASELEEQDSGSRRGRKSAKSTRHGINSDDEAMEDAEDTGDDETAAVADTAGSRLFLPEGATRVVVRAERIPAMSPSGPNGTWTCDQEGCAYVVRSVDEEDAQELIQEHFRHHEAQAQAQAEKINLAVKESRGLMPIKNLLEKIQAIGRSAFKKPTTLNGEPVPAPVKRRLLI